jgi:two-component system CheB/CheR fusion protein
VAQHLDPRRTSRLGEILSRHSTVPVRSVGEFERLEPGVVFVVPADRDIEIDDHSIRLSSENPRHPKPSIDLLLTSAAAHFGEQLIAVILTGTGSDGAAGARSVHAAGGTVVIQDPETASYPALPLSLAQSTVDIVADLKAIGPLLYELLTGSYTRFRPADDRVLRSFLEQLRERSGIDFANYKTPTIMRRLQRRLAATGAPDLEGYVRYLQRHPDEYQRLVSSFLIKVTEFFRDPELFKHLREHLLPELIAQARKHDNVLRLWSAGCSTGEESYSLAILVAEALGEELPDFSVRVFATDVDADAVAFARRGIYPASALGPVPPDLVKRYFSEVDGAFEVKKLVRTITVFGQHDLGQRAPFPRIDLTLCRNVLIYFTGDLQRRALQLFAFSLREGGYLILGQSETTSPLAEYFVLEQPRLKVYRRQGERALFPAARSKDVGRSMPPRLGAANQSTLNDLRRARGDSDVNRAQRERMDNIVQRMPVGVVVVDRRYDIQTINNTARQLLGIHGPAIGEDILHLAQGVASDELRAAVDGALRSPAQDTRSEQDVAQPVGASRHLRFVCYPEEPDTTGAERSGMAVVLIMDETLATERQRELERRLEDQAAQHARAAEQLVRLADGHQHLLSANQELSTANAELRSFNEELLLANEEAVASTEEVETLNEELQATNEELETLNEELQATVEELNTTNDDLQSRSAELQDLAASVEDQRRTSEAERARLRAVLASLPDAVAVVDTTGTPVLSNAVFERTFLPGLALTTARGEPLTDETSPLQRAARGETFQMRFAIEAIDGPRRIFEAQGEPIRGVQNQYGGVLVIREAGSR